MKSNDVVINLKLLYDTDGRDYILKAMDSTTNVSIKNNISKLLEVFEK